MSDHPQRPPSAELKFLAADVDARDIERLLRLYTILTGREPTPEEIAEVELEMENRPEQ
jgi:hypothetical protein